MEKKEHADSCLSFLSRISTSKGSFSCKLSTSNEEPRQPVMESE